MNVMKKLLRKSIRSTKLVNFFRDEGNTYFKNGKYFEALVSYNKSLCHAQSNSIDMSKSFADRSAVYFELKDYRLCLENIHLARNQPQYERSICLDERERRCKEFVENDHTKYSININKLSYPPHHKVPFIVDCLELSENDQFGRFITTSRNLRPGDVIAIDEPFFKFIDLEILSFYKYQRCFNCLKSNKLSLLPGPHSVMSCSRACHNVTAAKNLDSEAMVQDELDWEVVKMIQIKNDSEMIATNIETLEHLFYGNSKTIFDFDLNDAHNIETRKHLLKCAISLIGGTSGKVDAKMEIFKLMLSTHNEPQRDFFIKFVDHLMNVCRRTQFSLNIYDEPEQRFEKVGNCLLPFGGLMNHSCDPNLFWIPVEGKFVYIVARPVSAGEQLFLCYRKTFLREALDDRQKQLKKQYGFKCECPACVQNYPISKHFDELQIQHFQTTNQIHQEIARNWNEIEETFKTKPQQKTAELIAKNKLLLEYVASKFT